MSRSILSRSIVYRKHWRKIQCDLAFLDENPLTWVLFLVRTIQKALWKHARKQSKYNQVFATPTIYDVLSNVFDDSWKINLSPVKQLRNLPEIVHRKMYVQGHCGPPARPGTAAEAWCPVHCGPPARPGTAAEASCPVHDDKVQFSSRYFTSSMFSIVLF